MRRNFQKHTAALPDVFLSTRETSRMVALAVAEGRARKIGTRLYTSNMEDDPEAIVRRNLWRVVSLLAPGTVISYRTAVEMRPAEDGSVFLSTGYERRLQLPGVTLRFVKGAGPLEGDTPLWDVHVASRARAWLEALKPSRSRQGVARGLPRARIEDDLERELAVAGEAKLNHIRDQSRALGRRAVHGCPL